MENQCKNCIFSRYIYEQDFIVEGEKNDKLYCPMFDDGIPKKVLNDSGECTFRIDENEK